MIGIENKLLLPRQLSTSNKRVVFDLTKSPNKQLHFKGVRNQKFTEQPSSDTTGEEATRFRMSNI